MTIDITHEEIQTLSILDAIDGNRRVSQRELSKVTGLNLSKVNFLLRRLSEKGQVKLRNVSNNPNKLRYLYILTPMGLTEKSRLTIRFAARTLKEYSRTMSLIRRSLERLAQSGDARIVLVGATEFSDLVIEAAAELPTLSIVGIVSSGRGGGRHRGIPLMNDVEGISYDRAILCDHTEIHHPAGAENNGIPQNKIWLM